MERIQIRMQQIKTLISTALIIITCFLLSWAAGCSSAGMDSDENGATDLPKDKEYDKQFIHNQRSEKTLLPGTDLETELYIIRAETEGPTVLVVGGVHGNEQAGFIAAAGVVSWTIEKGTLLVIPRANVWGIDAWRRETGDGYDLNRAFPGDAAGNDAQRIAAAIYGVIEAYEPDWLLDLHESGNFHVRDHNRLGQTLIAGVELETFSTSLSVYEKLNSLLVNSPYYEKYGEDLLFQIVQPPAAGSTAGEAGRYDVSAVTVETTTRLDIEERVFQQLLVVNLYLEEIGLHRKLPYEKNRAQAEELTG